LSTDLRGLKRQVLTGLASRLAGTSVHQVAPRTRRNPDTVRLTWEFGNGTHGMVFVGTLKEGLPSGAFALEPRLIMSGGPLSQAIDSLTLPESPTWEANHYLVNADCRILGGAASTFVVRPGEKAGISRAEADIDGLLIPALEAFAGDWSRALDIAMAHPAAVSFAGAASAILVGWTGRVDLLSTLRQAADQDPWVRQGMSTEALEQVIDSWSLGPTSGLN
jgi:hypothetical protein